MLQAKFRIGPVNDPLEREADRVADAVVSGARPRLGATSTAVQAKCADCEAKEKTIQRQTAEDEKEAIQTKTGPGGSTTNGAALAASAVSSGGVPLPANARAYFEPRFGRDFSAVRIHTDAPAQSATQAINARAFALGRDIAFAPNEYAPSTHEGRRLIAHELAHVVQQDDPSVIRRTIRVDSQVSLTSYFAGAGITGITEATKVYSRTKGGATSNVQSVVIPMLSSPRVFDIDGEDTDTAVTNLKSHVNARLGIVAFAAQKKYSFASVKGFKMNPQYYTWDASTMSWAVKPGVDRQKAWEDINVNPGLYAIGCRAARDLTQAGGSHGSTFRDMPSSDESDWVPGDAGYVKNTKAKKGTAIELLGENIICTGDGKFWGHINSQIEEHSLDHWKTQVKAFIADGEASVEKERELPARGLA